MILVCVLLADALAAPVVAEAHLVGVLVPQGEASQIGGGGLGGGVGLATGRVMPELSASAVGLESGALRFTAMPQARVFLGEPWSPLGSLSLVAGAGVRAQAGIAPIVGGGVALDLGESGRWWPRIEARYLVDLLPDRASSAFQLQLGITRPPPRPAASAAAAAAVAEALPALDLPPDHLVWVPFPTCEWVLTQDAPSSLARFSTFDLFQPASMADRNLGGSDAAPHQGALLVVASPGDEVTVDGHALTLPRDATATVNATAGAHTVAVLGGGRTVSFEVGVSADHATWVRAPLPAQTIVHFEQGSSELTDIDAAEIRRIAAQAGGWFFEIMGSHSPEGDAITNAALAERRALIVAGLLADAGVSEGRMVIVPPVPPDPDLPLEEQRTTTVRPAVFGAGR